MPPQPLGHLQHEARRGNSVTGPFFLRTGICGSMYASERRIPAARGSMLQQAKCGADRPAPPCERKVVVLYTVAVVLVVLWLLGLVTSNTMGGVIHVLLVIAIIAVLLRVISGRRPL